MPAVSVIITNYNGQEVLGPCLERVLEQDIRKFEVIVVDNGSTDGSAKWIGLRFPEVRVIRMERNIGFAGGNNAGVRAARGRWVALLNNDTLVERNWLRELIVPLERGEAALVSSRVYTQHVDAKYYEKNGSISLLGYNVMRVFEDPEILFSATGCAVAFSRALFPVPFDEDYFFYSEDVYLSLRARFMGFNVKQAPRSVVHHVGSVSTKRMPLRVITFHQERNRLLNLLIFFSGSILLKLLPFVVLDFAARIITVALNYLNFDKPPRKSLVGVFQAYGWFVTHAPVVIAKRRRIQAQRRVRDEAVLAWMSCRFVNGDNLTARRVNSIAYLYCALMGIRTVEFQKEKRS